MYFLGAFQESIKIDLHFLSKSLNNLFDEIQKSKIQEITKNSIKLYNL